MTAQICERPGEWHPTSIPPACESSVTSRDRGAGDESWQALDEQLVMQARSGYQPAFDELCRRYSRVMKQRIFQIVRNHQDAEDILQESLLKAYTHLAGFQGHCKFGTWLTTIAVNSSLMLLRKRRRCPEASMDLVTTNGEGFFSCEVTDPSPNPEQLYAKRQAIQKVIQAVDMLPVGYRQVVQRYHQDEDRLEDAASAIGITPSAAKARLMRARRALRRHLLNSQSACNPPKMIAIRS